MNKEDYKKVYEDGLKIKLILQNIELRQQQTTRQIRELTILQHKLGQEKAKLHKRLLGLF